MRANVRLLENYRRTAMGRNPARLTPYIHDVINCHSLWTSALSPDCGVPTNYTSRSQPGAREHCSAPVSYTHLDVYKRQTLIIRCQALTVYHNESEAYITFCIIIIRETSKLFKN